MFFHGGTVIIEMFFNAVVWSCAAIIIPSVSFFSLCRAMNVIADRSCYTLAGTLHFFVNTIRCRAFVSSAFAVRGGEG